jgi:amino acid adenylation domain-containing protein/FkbH-like protein
MSIAERSSPADLETKRALLAERLRKAAAAEAALPLSFSQKRLWFLDLLEPESPLYNIGAVARLHGELDATALEWSLRFIIDRHEALRTRFVAEESEPRQVIGAGDFNLTHVDLSTLSAAESEAGRARAVNETVTKPFKLSTDLLLRARLLKISPTEHLLVLCFHHIVADEWSLKVFFQELGACYRARIERREPSLPSLPIQYADYTRWQRSRLDHPSVRRQLDYWRERLRGIGPVTELRLGDAGTGADGFRGGTVERQMGLQLSQEVKAWAQKEGATLFMVLLAAFKALVFRYTRQGDVVVGSPFAGRTRVETENLIGFFVNTVLLRTKVEGSMTPRQLLAAVRETALEAQANQDFPFEKLVEELHPERSLTHMPFTRLMFVVQNSMVESFDWGGISLDVTEAHTDTAKFDLTLVLQETSRGLIAKAEYNLKRFGAASVERLLGHYQNLLQGFLQSPEMPIARLTMLHPDEWAQLTAWGKAPSEYPREKTVHEVFEAQVLAWPDRIAVTYGPHSLSYSELNARANQLAGYLRHAGVGPEIPVMVCLRRSPELIVALLGILKAGGAYVPADSAYPRERLAFMMQDTGAPVLLTEQGLLSRIPAGAAKVICLDADWEMIARESRENPAVNVKAESLAYIMFTSGSTGTPKGVAIPHRAVNRLVLNCNWIRLGPGSRIAQISNVAFDAATFEIWGALLNGGMLVGISQAIALSPRDFAHELHEQQISAMFLTAALFNQLAAEAPGAFVGMDTLLAGGEPLDPKWVRSVLNNQPPQRLLNGYGPTENTTFACCHLIGSVPEGATSVPIGRPVSNTNICVLDENLMPVPIGVAGELYAGGDGLARGYWNRDVLTRERFVPNPFGSDSERLYRTGDRVRWLQDGTIEFLGRIDGQVKIRGFRIELGEVETVLGTHPDIRECAVTVFGQTAGSRKLVAYFTTHRGSSINNSDLRSFLADRLPDYMVPSAFVQLASLPLNANGKVDRRALPEPGQARPDLEKKYVRPADDVETRLVEIWEAVLKVKPIGVEDKFFELGGHSLLAVQVITRIEKAFGRKLRLATIFQTPTIRQIAAILREETPENHAARSTSAVAIQANGDQPPLFLVHGAGGGMFWGYVNLARHLGHTQPVYGFKSRGLDGKEEFTSIPELAEHYLNDLRVIQPEGPYYLGGYCFGGNVAFEMARQLRAAGEEVALLALLNCAPPNSSYMRIPWTPQWGARLARNLVYWAAYFWSWSSSQRKEFFRWKLGRIVRWLQATGGSDASRGRLEAANLVDLSAYTEEQRKVWEAHIQALVQFHPESFDGRVHLFRSPGHPLWCSFEPDYGWSEYARGGVEIVVVPGAHEKILDEPCVAHLAAELNKILGQKEQRNAVVQMKKATRMEVFKGLLVNTALFWLGANGELLSGEELGHGATSLAMLLHQVGSLRKTRSSKDSEDDPAEEPSSSGLEESRAPRLPLTVECMDVDEQTVHNFRELSRRLGLRHSELMLAVVKALLTRYTPEEEGGGELLALPTGLPGGPATCSIHPSLIPINATPEIPFEELAKRVGGSRLEQMEEPHFVAFELALKKEAGQTEYRVALRLTFESGGGVPRGKIELDPALFPVPSVQRLLGHWQTLLAGAMREPRTPVGKLPMVCGAERRRILQEWNNTAMSFPLEATYAAQYEAMAQRSPDAPAVVWQGGSWSYKQLNARANQLARRLQEAGVGPESLVAICLERSADLMASFLAVWKNGAAYVPLDPSYPKERLAFMLKDSQARVIITQRRFIEHLPGGEREVISLDEPAQKARIDKQSSENPPLRGSPENAAYVIYTSGSTGTPKGVVITQRSLLNHGHACGVLYSLSPSDRVLQFAAISFDISIEEIFPTWLAGGTVVLRSDEVISSISRFLEFVRTQEVTVLNLPTAYWHELVNGLESGALPGAVRLMVIGGEKASDEAFRRWRQLVPGTARLINSYGPTEATVTATSEIVEQDTERLTIGRPLPNTQAVILDSNLELVPIGVTGELCIGGAGLARGYLGRLKLTEEKFVANPFPQELPTHRLYRTGDLARFLEDGRIEFMGRRDQQVKIRGFRIELGEIESILRAHPQIADAVVVAREDEPGRKRLVAYYVARNGATAGAKQISGYMKSRLPGHMVPASFVCLPVLPKTPAGKIDRRSLPAPESGRSHLDAEFVPPSTAVEKALGQIWSEVLGLDRVGVADNFFDLGGDSLLATRVLSRIRETMRADVTMADLFGNPDISALAKHLVEQGQRLAIDTELMGTAMGSGVPLSAAQRRIWFLDDFDPDQSAYNLPLGLRLQGTLNVAALENSIRVIIERHEALRSAFVESGGVPVRMVCKPSAITLELKDLSGAALGQARSQAMLVAAQEAKRSHICTRPMLRVILLRVAPDEHFLVLVTHAIASDIESLRLVYQELTMLYEAEVQQQPNPLPPLPADYSAKMAVSLLSEDQAEASRDFWKEELDGIPALLELPADHPRPACQNDDGARHQLCLAPELWTRVQNFAREHGSDPFAVLLAAFSSVLHRYSNAVDVVVGAEVSLREQMQAHGLFGGFENEVAVRCQFTEDPSFSELLKRIGERWNRVCQNAVLPFADVLDAVQPPRDPSHTPIFQVKFTYDREPLPSREAAGLAFTPFAIENHTARLDLHLHFTNHGESAEGWIDYSTPLFEPDRMARLADHFQVLLAASVDKPCQKVSRLPLLSEAETRTLEEWLETRKPYPAHLSLYDLFVEQAVRTPRAEAVVDGNERLTYGSLFAAAGAVAERLKTLKVEPGEIVGICLGRSWEMIAAMLGVFRVGAAYVPLDPAYPEDRLQFMLKDSGARVVITDQKLSGTLPSHDAQVVCIEDIHLPRTTGQGTGPLPDPNGSDHGHRLAYVIYTSGSTGVPKGVELNHRGAVALVWWAREVFSAEELSGVLASTSICFDLSIFELFVPLCLGGRVMLAENALALARLPAAGEVRLVNTVPSAMRELLAARAVPGGVITVNLAGEPLASSLVDQIYAQTAVRNVYDLYGPTETTTYSTWALREPGETPTIGRPLPNESVWLLDKQSQRVPIGIPGELFIGGDGLARGYLNRSELSAQRFVPHPFQPDARLYRTGDLARWRRDGKLEYLGRLDHQVKIRGFRIELGEIEEALKQQPGVDSVVVVAREDRPGDKRLVAYLGSPADPEPLISELKAALGKRLPAYMIPARFVVLKQLPLTPNGKIDRKALPVPEPVVVHHDSEAPSSPLEEKLAGIWQGALGLVKPPGVRDNFFDLGGHSLLAMRVCARAREVLSTELPIRALFQAPTIRALAEGISNGQWHQGLAGPPPLRPVSRDIPLPVTFVQERLWFLDQIDPGGHAYNVPWAVRLQGHLDPVALRHAFEVVVARHEILRTGLVYENGALRQVIHASVELPWETEDLASEASGGTEARAHEAVLAESRRPFNLAAAPLMRVRLLRLSENEHLLIVVMHHAISDGWSLTLLGRELAVCYDAATSNSAPAGLVDLPLQYADFAHWQRGWMHGKVLDHELEYWKGSLAGAPAALDLPADFAAENPDNKGDTRELFLPPEALRKVNELSQREGITPFIVLMTCLAITLRRWTGQEDLVIGTVVAGRNRCEIEALIGCFMNFLPMRARLNEVPTAHEALRRICKTVLDGQAHQDCPFERMVEAMNPERRQNENPLYNVAFLYQNFPPSLFESSAIKGLPVQVSAGAALLDLRFEAEPQDGGLRLSCEYKTDLFETATVDHLLASLRQVIEVLLKDLDVPLEQFNVVPELAAQARRARERQRQEIINIAATFTAEPLEEPLRHWMRELQTPVAVHFAPFNQVFQQLLNPASLLRGNPGGLNLILVRLEDWLGAGANGFIEEAQTAVTRTANEFIQAMRASAISSTPHLVCLCPASPRILTSGMHEFLEETEHSLASELESMPGVFVLDSHRIFEWYPVQNYYDASAEALGSVPYTPLFFTALAAAVARRHHAVKRSPCKVIVLDCDNTLWSGVCGEEGPQGIRLEAPWKALQDFMLAQHASGRLLCLCSKNNEEDVEAVFAQRADMPLNRQHFTAVKLNWMPKSENLKALARELNLGLDSFVFLDDNPVECAEVEANCPEVLVLQLPEQPAQFDAFLRHAWVFDLLKVTEEDKKRAQMYHQNAQREKLRSETLSLADFLESLELKIRIEPMTTEQVTRAAQLTQRTNQFNFTTVRRNEAEMLALPSNTQVLSVQVSDRFGDYGLVGVVIFSIADHSLQLDTFLLSCRVLGRGVEHRIFNRLGHIAREHRVKYIEVPFVRSAKNKPALDFLQASGKQFAETTADGFLFRYPAGYAASLAPRESVHVEQGTAEGAALEVRSQISSRKFTRCREIALNLNEPEKIHRHFESRIAARHLRRSEYSAPHTTMERQLCQLWQNLLRVDRVGIRDNFFDLGGHSLLAVRLFAEIEQLTGRKFPLVTLFQTPTVEQLARVLTQGRQHGGSSLLVPIQPQGTRPPLFLVHGAGGDVLWGYANLAAHLGQDQPIYGIKSRGQGGEEEFSNLTAMAEFYASVLLQFQPEGPYLLGGYCFGGNVAYEMARILRQRGHEVSLVALIDSSPSNAGYERLAWWRPYRFARNLYYWLEDFAALKPEDRRHFFLRKGRALLRKLKQRFSRGKTGEIVDLEDVIDLTYFPENELKLWQCHLDALVQHVEQPYEGQVTLLRTRGQPIFCSFDEDFGWGRLVRGELHLQVIPGSHENIFVDPNVQVLARELEACLCRAQKPATITHSPFTALNPQPV